MSVSLARSSCPVPFWTADFQEKSFIFPIFFFFSCSGIFCLTAFYFLQPIFSQIFPVFKMSEPNTQQPAETSSIPGPPPQSDAAFFFATPAPLSAIAGGKGRSKDKGTGSNRRSSTPKSRDSTPTRRVTPLETAGSLTQTDPCQGSLLQAFNASASRGSGGGATPSKGTGLRASASLVSTPNKDKPDDVPRTPTSLLPPFPPCTLPMDAGRTPDEPQATVPVTVPATMPTATVAQHAPQDVPPMVPLPTPDFESTYAFAPPVNPPPRTTPLAIPASLQAAVVSKSIPLVGQNKFSRVEPFDGTFVDKIPIAPPDLFKLIAEHPSMCSLREMERHIFPPPK